jgi:hypothetical protein
MKDWGFIERLNQYLDGELPAEEVSRLETELQRDAGKMRLYRQYLRLQGGSVALARALESESIPPRVDLNRNVIWVPRTVAPRTRASRSMGWGYQAALGGAVALAALAFVFAPGGGFVDHGEGMEADAAAIAGLNQPSEILVSWGGASSPAASSQRSIPRLDGFQRMLAIEVPSDIPEFPASLPLPPSAPPSVQVRHTPTGGAPVFHGGSRGAFATASMTPSFASYEFSR